MQTRCLKSLDDILAQGEERLASWDFGCAVGNHSNHTAFAVLQGVDESAARSQLPASLRPGAKLVEVGKFTGSQVRSFQA